MTNSYRRRRERKLSVTTKCKPRHAPTVPFKRKTDAQGLEQFIAIHLLSDRSSPNERFARSMKLFIGTLCYMHVAICKFY